MTPGKLVVRRTITNITGATVTVAQIRLTAISEAFGAKQPGVTTQPGTVALLRAVNPTVASEQVTITGGSSVTVYNLSVAAPISGGLGGGLNSTLIVPLPGGGLAPNATISVAFTFAVDTHGTFWFGYDVDALTGAAARGQQPALRPAQVARRGTGRTPSALIAGRTSAQR